MDSEQQVFDNVKFEKAKAMAMYNRFRKITNLLQVLEVFVALMLISWSSTRLPGALKFSGRVVFEVAHYLFNPHIVFVIGNVIIVLLFILCRKNDAGHENSGSGDLYDDYVRHSEVQQRKLSVSEGVKNPPAQPPPPASTQEVKDVIVGGGGDCGDEEEEKQIVCVSSEENTEQCDAVTTAIEKATKQIEMFQRTQSVKQRREIAAKPQAAFRRSETVKVRRGRAGRPVMTSFDTVDKLSNEEFNQTIDAFIKRHQEFLKEQKLAEK